MPRQRLRPLKTFKPRFPFNMSSQLEMFVGGISEEHVALLLRTLRDGGWQSRRQLAIRLGWEERTIRRVAEMAGPAVVRGPKGFACFESATDDDIHHAADVALHQARKMEHYALDLKRRLHARIA